LLSAIVIESQWSRYCCTFSYIRCCCCCDRSPVTATY
uniref:CX domain-containing protein n=1 Tax=Brugia timori TaxID=42155 RepID=A0A0R3RD97_9BILA